jgi:hypothetical protein
MRVPENVYRGDTLPDPSGYSGQCVTASAPVLGIIGFGLDVAVTQIDHCQMSFGNESPVVRFAAAAVA